MDLFRKQRVFKLGHFLGGTSFVHSMPHLMQSFFLLGLPNTKCSCNLKKTGDVVTFLLHSGWQYQESPPTIQCIMEKALMSITKLERKDLSFVGASRTDAGVHAWGQV